MRAPDRAAMPLAVENLAVDGEGGRRILSVAALSLEPGQSLGIRGPSGAGKSTLLYALAGLLPRAAGAVRWGGTDILSLRSGRRAAFRRRNMGFVFQEPMLFEEMGASANAALVAAFSRGRDRRAIERRGDERLAALGVPAGVRRAGTFSGGERQRIALARALANEPAILLADEPTASLDRATADRLIDDIRAFAGETGRSLIAVSHDASLLAAMDRVVTIENGTLS